jgi:predicted NodU family carbamoyl transferase
MYILGLKIRHESSSACIFVDGKLTRAFEEERFIRIKNISQFLINSIKYFLNQVNIGMHRIKELVNRKN